ncbi:hypothetical protein AJ80_01191 [Polytolypa hystricis UAMH7299]|uniref:RNase III domain-containing protein n=1 Tax=Polytolypa hystricis (strain UAMH7299) TaxID=1447883 RepID=A0A2B7YT67_POLH7|nr:hypothetical protein AJ80_01191 [Polytolypa hystricis UAMH7299]
MKSKIPAQAFAAVKRPVRWRTLSPLVSSSSSSSQHIGRYGLSSTVIQRNLQTEAPLPRWQHTPPAMKAPVRLRGGNPNALEFPVNSDPAVLDEFYSRMLGSGGVKTLSEEIKWQAVTHKSFDQGRRGFNDRLAYLGKHIVQLQASLATIQESTLTQKPSEDRYGRTPPDHPSLQGLESLNEYSRRPFRNNKQLGALAKEYGLDSVVRWVPKKRDNLDISGYDVVLVQALYAVVGAIAMEKGGLVANEVARERILKPLGYKIGSL